MNSESTVVVLGAGVIGLCLALGMAQRGQQVKLLDRGNYFKTDRRSILGRVYALNPTSLALLKHLGVLERCATEAMTPYERMEIWVANRSAEIDFDSRLVGSTQLGMVAEESALLAALFALMQETPAIEYCPESCVQVIQENATHLLLADGEKSWEASLALIADGAHSSFRQMLNLPLTQWSYRQEALITTVMLEKPHRNRCYQVFLPEGPLAFLPLSHSHTCAMVWSADSTRATELREMSEAMFNQEMTRWMSPRLGNIQRQGACTQFPLTMRHIKQYIGKHWAIFGDAAHTIHPMAGLGLNMGMADVQEWFTQWDKMGHRALSRALRGYQCERQVAVWKTILMMEGLKTLFATSFAPLQGMRDWGIQQCQQSPFLKRFFIQQASQV